MALLPVLEATQRILSHARLMDEETLPLNECLHRTLAQDIKAQRNQPPFNASAMDGYALKAADIVKLPATLEVIGTSAAGHQFSGAVGPNQAVRIFTGAPLPSDCDTIVIQENTNSFDNMVEILHPSPKGRHIRKIGMDYTVGDVVLQQGRMLDARAIGLAASANNSHLPVRKKPTIAIISTGDELVAPGNTPADDQIISSNSSSLFSACKHFGANALDIGIVPDQLPALENAVKRAETADIIVTIGGASVGDHDLVEQVLNNTGYKLDFWRIAMRPGKPLIFSTKGEKIFLGLPGNPVSSLVCALLFIKPLIARMQGREIIDETFTMPLAADMEMNDEREDYVRGHITPSPDGSLAARPVNRQDSSQQRIFADANCLIIRPPLAKAAKTGDLVKVLPLDL